MKFHFSNPKLRIQIPKGVAVWDLGFFYLGFVFVYYLLFSIYYWLGGLIGCGWFICGCKGLSYLVFLTSYFLFNTCEIGFFLQYKPAP